MRCGPNVQIVIAMAVAVMVGGLAGCAPGSGVHLIETRFPLTGACQSLGIVSETADAGHLSALMARATMVRKVERHAAQLGATHIVWLHKTDTSAAAHAFRCPSPEPHSQRVPEPDSPENIPVTDAAVD